MRATKRDLLEFLIGVRRAGAHVVGYGAPAKGNTLLNYCGVRGDLLDYVVDLSPHKQGLYLPGTRLPIYSPERIAETKPDYVLILPWNLARRDREADGARARLGRPLRRADPGPAGARVSLDRSALPGPEQAGAEMHELMRELFPFCRSLTGDGVRQTFEVIERDMPLGSDGGAERHAGLRLDAPARVEHPRREADGTRRRADRRLRRLEPARPRLQRARSTAPSRSKSSAPISSPTRNGRT